MGPYISYSVDDTNGSFAIAYRFPFLAPNPGPAPFRWQVGRDDFGPDLPTPRGYLNVAYDEVNNRGDVIGHAQPAQGGGPSRYILWPGDGAHSSR